MLNNGLPIVIDTLKRIQAALELRKGQPCKSSRLRIAIVSLQKMLWLASVWMALSFIHQPVWSVDLIPFGFTHIDDISSDGTVAVGRMSSNSHPYRWTKAGGFVELATVTNFNEIIAVSGDGNTITGTYQPSVGRLTAYIWTSTGGFSDLISSADADNYAYDISEDGTKIAGYSNYYLTIGARAFEWTSSGGKQTLQNYGPPHDVGTQATVISGDGTVIGGTAAYGATTWTSSGISAFAPALSYPVVGSISRNGTVITGSALGQSYYFGWYWTQQTGLHVLNDYAYVDRVSPDGRFLVMHGAGIGDATIYDLVTGQSKSLYSIYLEQGGVSGIAPYGFGFVTSFNGNASNGYSFGIGDGGGGNFFLSGIQLVPEPSIWALGATATGVLGLTVRRRKQNAK